MLRRCYLQNKAGGGGQHWSLVVLIHLRGGRGEGHTDNGVQEVLSSPGTAAAHARLLGAEGSVGAALRRASSSWSGNRATDSGWVVSACARTGASNGRGGCNHNTVLATALAWPSKAGCARAVQQPSAVHLSAERGLTRSGIRLLCLARFGSRAAALFQTQARTTSRQNWRGVKSKAKPER